MKWKLPGILLTLLLLLSLWGCGRQPYSGEPLELWLVTEESRAAGMNQQAEMVMEQFRELYPNVTIRMDILPRSEEARDAYLKKIRSEIMSGGGPDLYLMPTYEQSFPEQEAGSTPFLEPLFSNVPQQMYNGIFTDLGPYYDADDNLGKEGLMTGVMDAGVMDGARYVLPLRYDYDVLLVDLDALQEMGIDPSVLNGGIDQLYALAETLQSAYASYGLMARPDFTHAAQYIDFQTENVLLDPQEYAALVQGYYRTLDLSDPESHQDVGEFLGGHYFVTSQGYPGYSCDLDSSIYLYSNFTYAGYPFMRISMSQLVDAAATIKHLDLNVAMYPIRASGGSLVAEITYYGAVGSGCKYPEVAYEFLRMFYSETLQWEQYDPRNAGKDLDPMVERGYPVRSLGSIGPFYENIRTQLEQDQANDRRMKEYARMKHREPLLDPSFTVTDEDVPIFSIPVEEARFPVVTADGDFFYRHFSRIETTEDAAAMIAELKWLLAEG